MSINQILKILLWLALKVIGILGLIFVVVIIWKLVGLLPATPGLILVLVLIAIYLLILWLDKGVPLITAGCSLIVFSFKPDRCITTTCAKPCIPITGPYPKWMGGTAILTQHVGCICSTNPFAALAPQLQQLLNSANKSKLISELMRLMEKLIQGGINDPRIDRLDETLRKLQQGGEMSDDDTEFLEELLEEPNENEEEDG